MDAAKLTYKILGRRLLSHQPNMSAEQTQGTSAGAASPLEIAAYDVEWIYGDGEPILEWAARPTGPPGDDQHRPYLCGVRRTIRDQVNVPANIPESQAQLIVCNTLEEKRPRILAHIASRPTAAEVISPPPRHQPNFDDFGNYKEHVVQTKNGS